LTNLALSSLNALVATQRV
jgi:hypothetical protein